MNECRASATAPLPSVMHFYSGPPMHILSGVDSYGAEFDFRYNTRVALGYSDMDRAEKIAAGMIGKPLTYRRPRQPQEELPDF